MKSTKGIKFPKSTRSESPFQNSINFDSPGPCKYYTRVLSPRIPTAFITTSSRSNLVTDRPLSPSSTDYNFSKDIKDKTGNKSVCFATSKRPDLFGVPSISNTPGPGSYNTVIPKNDKSIKIKEANNLTSRETIPGPADYNVDTSNKKHINSPHFSKEKRVMPFECANSCAPGPGSYSRKGSKKKLITYHTK